MGVLLAYHKAECEWSFLTGFAPNTWQIPVCLVESFSHWWSENKILGIYWIAIRFEGDCIRLFLNTFIHSWIFMVYAVRSMVWWYGVGEYEWFRSMNHVLPKCKKKHVSRYGMSRREPLSGRGAKGLRTFYGLERGLLYLDGRFHQGVVLTSFSWKCWWTFGPVGVSTCGSDTMIFGLAIIGWDNGMTWWRILIGSQVMHCLG